MWLPKRPHSLEEAKIEPTFVEDTILKILGAVGATRGGAFADMLKLPYSLVEPFLAEMREKDLIAPLGGAGIGGNAGLDFGLTPKGIELTAQVKHRSSYAGPAPVEISDYITSVHSQKFQFRWVKKKHLDAAFSDIMISQEYLAQLGPAINSGGPIFLYGKPGNGKTTMSERIARLFRQGMFVPYAIQVNGEVIQVFDEKIHKPVPMEMLPDDHPLKADPKCADPRWVYVFRPFIVVGGEMTLEMLDLSYRAGQASYEGPFQLKANGGVLLIDDFGRQKVKPMDLLNRWIYPLEKGMDFLSLVSGKKIEVPFEQLIIFSTNLDPRALGDEAFWRRIKYMIETPNPTDADFKKIFQVVCGKNKIMFDEDAYNYLVEKYYKATGKEFRSVHPRDILNRTADHISYYGLEPKMTRSLVDQVCKLLFGGLDVSGEAPPQIKIAG